MSNIIPASEIPKAAKLLKEGAVLLHRADTIWGLICDATSKEGVNKISQIKARQAGMSYIILVNNDAMIERFVREVPEVSWDIVESAVEPITIIYPEGMGLVNGVRAEDKSIAIRLVKEPDTVKLIQYLGRPIVSTSANISGKPSATSLADMDPEIMKRVDGIISDEGRKTMSNKASSIIKIGLHGEVKIIRS